MRDAFNIKLHSLKYLYIKGNLQMRFSFTWEFIQGGSGKIFSDTMSGNLAWVDKEKGDLRWTPHMSRIGRNNTCFHTVSLDLKEFVTAQLASSPHIKALFDDRQDRIDSEAQEEMLPEILDGDMEESL